MIRYVQTTVLYGKSGLGKSSLIEAALIPALRKEGQYEILNIRLNPYTADAEDLVERVRARLGGTTQDAPQEAAQWLAAEASNLTPFWTALKARQLANPSEAPAPAYFLVFDQFEELFTYPPSYLEAFVQALTALLQTGVPQWVYDALEKNSPSPALERVLLAPLDLKLMVAIRSDRLHLLNKLTKWLPDILKHCYELQPLSQEDAAQAMQAPAQAEGLFASPSFHYQPEAIQRILAFLSADTENQRIEAIQLQTLCRYFEEKVMAEGLLSIRLTETEDLKGVMAQHYFTQLEKACPAPETRLAARRLMENGLVLEYEKMRVPLYLGQIKETYGLEEASLQDLVKHGLLRAEVDLRRGYTYELAHDTLIDPILKAKKDRLAEETAQREAAQAAQIAQLQGEKTRSRRIAFGFALLACLAIAASVFAWMKMQEAEGAKTEALHAKNKAEKAKTEAFHAKNVAESKTREALEAHKRADSLRENADQAAEEARLALAAKKEEEKQRKAIKAEEYRRNVQTYLAVGDCEMALKALYLARENNPQDPELSGLQAKVNNCKD